MLRAHGLIDPGSTGRLELSAAALTLSAWHPGGCGVVVVVLRATQVESVAAVWVTTRLLVEGKQKVVSESVCSCVLSGITAAFGRFLSRWPGSAVVVWWWLLWCGWQGVAGDCCSRPMDRVVVLLRLGVCIWS